MRRKPATVSTIPQTLSFLPKLKRVLVPAEPLVHPLPENTKHDGIDCWIGMRWMKEILPCPYHRDAEVGSKLTADPPP